MKRLIFKTKKGGLILLVSIIFLCFFVVLPTLLYIYNPFGEKVYSIFKILPYPVAIIDGKNAITTRTLFEDTASIKHFYETQDFSSAGMRIDFSTDDGKFRLKIKEKEILNKLIEDKLVENISKDRGISVSKEEIEDNISKLSASGGTVENFEGNLKRLYGWDLNKFRKKIVPSQIFLGKIINYYKENESAQGEKWDRVQEARSRISSDGSNFCEIVKSYSEGDGVDNCGDVGWFEQEQLEPEIAETVFGMKSGEISKVIKSSLGFHIILLEEDKQVDKNGKSVREVKLKQIFVNDGGFVNWIRERKKEHSVYIPMKDYKWDKESASVKFAQNEFETKEKMLRIKSEGDPIFY